MSGHPAENEFPKALIIPPRFRENNLWRLLEEAAQNLGRAPEENYSPVPVMIYPNLPPETGGICIFEGPLREFLLHIHPPSIAAQHLGGQSAPSAANPAIPSIQFQAAICVLPRPNQAFWTLSALWAGWLWGQESAAPFKSVLRRRRYDWAWHTTALQAAFENLAGLLKPAVPVLGLSEENEPGLFSAACLAAYAKKFELLGLEARRGSLHILWQAHAVQETTGVSPSQRRQAAARAASEYLNALGLTATYIRLFMAGSLAGLAQDHLLPADSNAPADNYAAAQTALREALTFGGGFHRYNPGESPETGLYWLRSDQTASEPLADRLEKLLVTLLVRQPAITTLELERRLQAFPDCSPNPDQILTCLASYALEDPPASGKWTLRPEDRPAARRA
ncbi:MAG: hypothetical protein IPN59_12795 [Holophaga sp.]|nr:hypothetical protein [Holophaga sp.]